MVVVVAVVGSRSSSSSRIVVVVVVYLVGVVLVLHDQNWLQPESEPVGITENGYGQNQSQHHRSQRVAMDIKWCST